ncbi:hypothetical protein K488DRAFT_83810 [Vararia minispora EC-137]|uniref:Uncharacterized protein n=1 Tax=Vararia minispora EC-137 TaxID=1314806 RepID=A0ACB8QST0_9AGAM|nr:hypothetical protein K488DRAFT_83810 [Vararia minispora EC-137]
MGLRFLFRGRRRKALRRLVLNPKEAESKLRWTMVKPPARGNEKACKGQDEANRSALVRIKSLLSHIPQPPSFEDDQYLRRPPPAVLRRELLVRRHSVPIGRQRSVSAPPAPQTHHFSATPDPVLRTITEDDDEQESKDVRLGYAPTMRTINTQLVSSRSSMDLADAAGIANTLLESSSTSLSSFESVSLDDKTAASSVSLLLPSMQAFLSDARSHTSSDWSDDPSSDASAQRSISSMTSIEVSDSDACVIRRAMSLRVKYKRGTTIVLPPTGQEQEQTYVGDIGALPRVVVTGATEVDARTSHPRDSLPLSAASSGFSVALSVASSCATVDLDDFPIPPLLVDTLPAVGSGSSLAGTIERSFSGATADSDQSLGLRSAEPVSKMEVAAIAVTQGARVVLSDVQNTAGANVAW